MLTTLALAQIYNFYLMVSEGWETSTNWWEDAVLCQEQFENKMEAQMSNILIIHMLFTTGLTKIQDGGEIPTGNHYNMVTFQTQVRSGLSACSPFLSHIFINYKS